MKYQIVMQMKKDDFTVKPLYKKDASIYNGSSKHYAIFDSFEEANSCRIDLQNQSEEIAFFILVIES